MAINRIDNILYPDEAYNEYKNSLISMYIDDYGEENYKKIKKRIDETYYLFDSNPEESLKFLDETNSGLLNLSRSFRFEIENSNYISCKKKIDNSLCFEFKEYLSNIFGISSRYIDENFLKMDFDAFSFKSMRKLHRGTDVEKKEIESRQTAYIRTCELYGVKPVTSLSIIEGIISEKNRLDKLEKKLLVEDTIWGKRIKENIVKTTGYNIPSDILADLLFLRGCCACVINIPNPKGNVKRICVFPCIHNYYIGLCDVSFLHENRHVVESDKNFVGLHILKDDGYVLLNELRTEINAIRDSKKFIDSPLFSNSSMNSKYVSFYDRLLYYSFDFVNDNLDVLNKLAFNNDVNGFESLFGKDNLEEFDYYLAEVDYLFRDNSSLIDEEKGRELVKELNNHFASRL